MSGVGLAPVSPAAERGGTICDGGESNIAELGEPSGLGDGAVSPSTLKPVSQPDNQPVSQPASEPTLW